MTVEKRNWVADLTELHRKFRVKVDEFPIEKLKDFLRFRLDFLKEELQEIEDAESAEEIVDGLIDMCVVAIGTLDAFKVDADQAWNVVHKANSAKEVGINPKRPNEFGLPDLIKPEGWKAPNHEGNVGLFAGIMADAVYDVYILENGHRIDRGWRLTLEEAKEAALRLVDDALPRNRVYVTDADGNIIGSAYLGGDGGSYWSEDKE